VAWRRFLWEISVALASLVVVEQLVQIDARVSQALAKLVSQTRVEADVSMMAVAVAEPPPPAQAPAPARAPVLLEDRVACTVEQQDPAKSTCLKQQRATVSTVLSWLSSWLNVHMSAILSTQ